jgi:hypothetical protein
MQTRRSDLSLSFFFRVAILSVFLYFFRKKNRRRRKDTQEKKKKKRLELVMLTLYYVNVCRLSNKNNFISSKSIMYTNNAKEVFFVF